MLKIWIWSKLVITLNEWETNKQKEQQASTCALDYLHSVLKWYHQDIKITDILQHLYSSVPFSSDSQP